MYEKWIAVLPNMLRLLYFSHSTSLCQHSFPSQTFLMLLTFWHWHNSTEQPGSETQLGTICWKQPRSWTMGISWCVIWPAINIHLFFGELTWTNRPSWKSMENNTLEGNRHSHGSLSINSCVLTPPHALKVQEQQQRSRVIRAQDKLPAALGLVA